MATQKLIIKINTNNTTPVAIIVSLCKSAAYPISLTIAVVRKRTELNGNGGFTELPATKVIAIASPIALPVPSTMAVMIPDFAAGTVTLKIVVVGVAPKAKDASR